MLFAAEEIHDVENLKICGLWKNNRYCQYGLWIEEEVIFSVNVVPCFLIFWEIFLKNRYIKLQAEVKGKPENLIWRKRTRQSIISLVK